MSNFGRFKVHPFADEFPLMEGEGFVSLVENIKKNGLKKPIELCADGETMADGRNRYRACDEAGVEPHYTTLPSTFTEADIIAHIWSANGERRNLSTGHRAFLALLSGELLAEAAYGDIPGEPRRPTVRWRSLPGPLRRLNRCGMCGVKDPRMFDLPDVVWRFYIEPTQRGHMVCLRCWSRLVEVTDGGFFQKVHGGPMPLCSYPHGGFS